MLHLYALAQHPAELAETAGIDGFDVRTLQVAEGIDAVVSDLATNGGQPTETAVLDHAAVVEELAGVNDALLPARFERGHADESALVAAIAERVPAVRAALERIRGCVELGVRVFDEGSGANGSELSSGREYMTARLEEVRAAERLAEEVHDGLAARARDSSSRVLASPQLLLSAAYLLRRAELDSFRAGLDEIEAGHPGLTFVCTGPWPPYSFAMLDQART